MNQRLFIKALKLLHPGRRWYILFFVLLFAATLAGCQSGAGERLPSSLQVSRNTATAAPAPTGSPSTANAAQTTEEPVLETPTPAPTATPGELEILVEDVSRRTGVNRFNLLGVTGVDLINVMISTLIVFLGLVTGLGIVKVLRWFAGQTPSKIDDRLVDCLDEPLIIFTVVIAMSLATSRLEILAPVLKQWLDLAYYAGYVLAGTILAWRDGALSYVLVSSIEMSQLMDMAQSISAGE